MTTSAGSWVAPGNRAIWVPAGTVHAHRAYGELELHLFGLPAASNPLGLDTPTVLSVAPLLRELIVAYTGAAAEPTQLRLHHALILLADRTPVTTVAHRCGWSSASAFIDAFRRTFGHTPGAHPGWDGA
ncbi:helix-turn-helix domain-containing protein [Paractinoplanes aksuensis]|uniref:helix-turn-helix domain-containing protein n=1 Tax=Paractinoplanes aksuensis TaxID=2939490 RepID=UPI0034DAE5A6